MPDLTFFGYDFSNILRIFVNIVILLLVLLAAVKVVNRVFKKLRARMAERNPGADQSFIGFFRYVVLAVLYICAIAATVAQVPALESMMTTLLAGSGIAALIIGVASQDAVGNIVSGALIILFKPFRVGDTIRYVSEDITGVVEEIGLRHTVIRTYENKHLIIPNAAVNSGIVENGSHSHVSFTVDARIPIDADVTTAMEIMACAIKAHPGFFDARSETDKQADKPAVTVRAAEIGSGGIVLRSWVTAKTLGESFQMKSDMLLGVKRALDAEGIHVPHSRVIIENHSGGGKEEEPHEI